ncbi:hypothetical protein Q4567_18690 [Aliiglaciecola sp. 2_MG-2023]|uniref:hypothetical protein n=1 Tax=Alteromonadaceae TaxID=72275 RepID=UPI0026E488A2|nr:MULTISPECIES: hypothetical protein [unclassified Aliiglaciecola]MDO6712769.1 hypothetical protein [Aliiglaciecola sp. 2_MG-2023]MDO6753832.1 hypothetical protein [Aliiglaciecola sp. 1_MG-2023]
MDIVIEILKNTSLWEILFLFGLIYLFSNRGFRERITKIKFGDFELELMELKKEVQEGKEKIVELEAEVENDRRLFEDILDSFDPSAPVSELAAARRAIKSEAQNLSEVDSLRKYLRMGAQPEELYVAAVSIRERRPVTLLPDLIGFLDELSDDRELGGFRLNTVWTLVSALHLTLISSIRDGVGSKLNQTKLNQAEKMLCKLEKHTKVQSDRPDNPLKGIRGPVKHALNWVKKGIKDTA